MLMKKLLLGSLFMFSVVLVGCGTPAAETGAVTGEDTERNFCLLKMRQAKRKKKAAAAENQEEPTTLNRLFG